MKALVTLLLSGVFCQLLYSQQSDTILVNARVIYVDTMKCQASHHFSMVEKLMLVETLGYNFGCKGSAVFSLYTNCECELKYGKIYSFKITKSAYKGMVPNEPRYVNRVEFCDDYVLKQRSDYDLIVLEINGHNVLEYNYIKPCDFGKALTKKRSATFQ